MIPTEIDPVYTSPMARDLNCIDGYVFIRDRLHRFFGTPVDFHKTGHAILLKPPKQEIFSPYQELADAGSSKSVLPKRRLIPRSARRSGAS